MTKMIENQFITRLTKNRKILHFLHLSKFFLDLINVKINIVFYVEQTF